MPAQEGLPVITALCSLFLKKLDSKFKRLSDMSFCFSLNIMSSCYTLSNALDMSSKTLQTSRPPSNDFYISRVIDSSWFIQESPGLKPEHFIKLQSIQN